MKSFNSLFTILMLTGQETWVGLCDTYHGFCEQQDYATCSTNLNLYAPSTSRPNYSTICYIMELSGNILAIPGKYKYSNPHHMMHKLVA